MSRLAAALLTAALAAAPFGPGAALAAWNPPGNGAGTAKAKQMPAGNQPTASVSNHSVTVSWSASSFAGGGSIGGYAVKRYDNSGNVQSIGSACSGTISGLSCTETSVPAGNWRYTVTPMAGSGWTGAESAQSTAITVQSPALTITSSTTVTALPSALSGNIADFSSGQTVSFRLDNPSSGPVLSSSISPTPVPANGNAAISVTVPAGTANGSHVIYAIGSGGETASAAITVSAPTITASVLAKSAGCTSDYLDQSGSYRVYANVTGSPSAVSADLSAITSGQGSAAMTAGSYNVNGTAYNYRSALLTANASLAAGSQSYTVTATGGGSGNGTITVDNTAPTAVDIQTTNVSGGTAGHPELGDTLTLSYSEIMDPCSISSGWIGSSALSVVVRITNNGSNDTVTVWNATNTIQLPLGTVATNGNPVTANTTFGASGTPSTLVQSGTNLVVVLGTVAGSTRTNTSTVPMLWTPSTAAFDRAGNANTAASATETGAGDRNF